MESNRKLIKTLSRNIKSGLSSPEFFGFVRRLEQAKPDLPRIGYAKLPKDENVRFGQMPHLHFPPSEIADISEGRGNVDAIVMTYFFGLLGVNGPMPLEFTSYVLTRSHNYYDHAWRRFLDIIHHRMLTLFYRAFSINQQAISYDRRQDSFVGIIKNVAGFEPKLNTNGVRESLILRYAHRFREMVKNRASLEEMLSSILKLKVRVKDFIQERCDIPHEYRAVMGSRQTMRLGVNLQIGRSYISISKKFELRIGAITYKECLAFLPTGRAYSLIKEAVKLYLDRLLDYDINITLISESIPAAILGSNAVMLGYAYRLGGVKSGYAKLVIRGI
jgi:type VI secretion system protein ImpH